MLISFDESYCPSGGTTERLTPTMVLWRNAANSWGVMAGAPKRSVAKRSLGSAGPNRSTSAGEPKYKPSTFPTTTGTTSPTLADRPARPNARVYANAVVLIVALASSMGAEGSNAKSPQLRLLTTVTMLRPL